MISEVYHQQRARGASLIDYRYIKRFYYFSQLIIQYTNLFIDK